MTQRFIINTQLETLNRDYRSKTLPTSLLLFHSALSFSFFYLYVNSSIALRGLNILTEPHLKKLFSRLLTNIQQLSQVHHLYTLCGLQEIVNLNINIDLDKQVPTDPGIKTKYIKGLSLVKPIGEDIISFLNTYDRHMGTKIIEQIQQLPFSINDPFSLSSKTTLDKISKANGTFTDSETDQLAEILQLAVPERSKFDESIRRLVVFLRTTRTVNDYLKMKLENMENQW